MSAFDAYKAFAVAGYDALVNGNDDEYLLFAKSKANDLTASIASVVDFNGGAVAGLDGLDLAVLSDIGIVPEPSQTPEPATLLVLGLGLAGLGLGRRRK